MSAPNNDNDIDEHTCQEARMRLLEAIDDALAADDPDRVIEAAIEDVVPRAIPAGCFDRDAADRIEGTLRQFARSPNETSAEFARQRVRANVEIGGLQPEVVEGPLGGGRPGRRRAERPGEREEVPEGQERLGERTTRLSEFGVDDDEAEAEADAEDGVGVGPGERDVLAIVEDVLAEEGATERERNLATFVVEEGERPAEIPLDDVLEGLRIQLSLDSETLGEIETALRAAGATPREGGGSDDE